MTHRLLFAAAGLCGALGVALSAAAAHRGGDGLSTAATFLLLHAPAIMILSRHGSSRAEQLASGVLLAGLVLFSGDLAARAFLGVRLFAYAAPLGGVLLIAGWLAAAASVFFTRRE